MTLQDDMERLAKVPIPDDGGHSSRVYTVPTELVFIDPQQVNPRIGFDEKDIASLAESIKQQGQLQPALVRGRDGGQHGYWLIFGERRWRACQLLGIALETRVADVSYEEALVIALRENLDRAQLTQIEEAVGLSRIVRSQKLSQRELAKLIDKSQAWVANRLRLLELPPVLQDYVSNERIAFSVARDVILPFRSLRPEYRDPFFNAITAELERKAEQKPGSIDVGPIVERTAIEMSRPLRSVGGWNPKFDAQVYHRVCDCGAPAFVYDKEVGPEVRCFNVEAWDRAQERAGRVPSTREEPAAAAPAPKAPAAPARKAKPAEPERVEREVGVLLVDTAGVVKPAPILQEELNEKTLRIERIEAGPLVWWIAGPTQRQEAGRRWRQALEDRTRGVMMHAAQADAIAFVNVHLDVRALQELVELPFAAERGGEREVGGRLLFALNDLAWSIGLESAPEGDEILPWWKQRPPEEVKRLVQLLLHRYRRDGAAAIRVSRAEVMHDVRAEMAAELQLHIWSLVGSHYE